MSIALQSRGYRSSRFAVRRCIPDTGEVTDNNLFSMLSAYRPGSVASPFENYCTSGLAYFLQRGHRMLTALFAHTAGLSGAELVMAEVQPRLGDVGYADLLLTFEGGDRILVEVQTESGANEDHLPAFEADAAQWTGQARFIILGLKSDVNRPPWVGMSWLQVVEALEDDPDPLVAQYVDFVLKDVLGLGEVSLDQAITTNRLSALGAAAVRRKFGDRAVYQNSASRPLGGKYRYLGTTFALDGGPMQYWVGIVNEQVPLSEHYHLMLASKTTGLREPVAQPRATGDWKEWPHWTGLGRVVRPISMENYQQLLKRLEAE